MQIEDAGFSVWASFSIPQWPLSRRNRIRAAVIGAMLLVVTTSTLWPKRNAPQFAVAEVHSANPTAIVESENQLATTAELATQQTAISETIAKPSASATAASQSAASIESPEVDIAKPIDRTAELLATANRFAGKLQRAVADGDLPAIRSLIDWPAIIKKSMLGMPLPPEAVESFLQDVLSWQHGPGLDQTVVDAVQNGGSYQVLRARLVDESPRVLFRLLNSAGVFNYHEFHLEPSGDDFVAVDAWVALSGETLSQTLHRSILALVRQFPLEDGQSLDARDREYVQNLWRLEQITAKAKTHPADALHIARQLPPALQRDKSVLLARLMSAQAMGKDEYSAAVIAYRKAYPDDAAAEMISVEFHVINKDFDKALACIDKINAAVGGDEYLNMLRASVYLADGNVVRAIEACQAAINAEPELPHAFWTLLQISLDQRAYPLTVTLLEHLEGRMGAKLGDLRIAAEFKDFVKSSEFRQWDDARLLK